MRGFNKAKQLVKTKDLTIYKCIAIGLLLTVLKLLLTRSQQVFLWPDESGLDDNLMYQLANNIVNGEWLGSYNWLTLSKHSFYALWLAALYWLNIPVLLAGQILWASACALSALAYKPLFKRRWLVLSLYILLLFLPSSTANPFPLGYITRVYRDNIFPSLCLMATSGMVGFALRRRLSTKNFIAWLILAGFSMGACYLTREDGWWIFIFCFAAAALTIIFRYFETKKSVIPILFASTTPFVIMLICLFAWSGMNWKYYHRFIVSDFSSGEFVDAYSAITSLTSDTQETGSVVSSSTLNMLYQNVEAFAPLKPFLNSQHNISRYANYNAGAFYWALREAAFEAGYYSTPQTAKEYYSTLSNEIRQQVENGTLKNQKSWKSLIPTFRLFHAKPFCSEMMQSLYFCTTFQQCEAQSLISIGHYQEKLEPMEQFLHEKSLTACMENSSAPYYSRLQRIFYSILNSIQLIYSVFTPVMLLIATIFQIYNFFKPNIKNGNHWMSWCIRLGLLCNFLFRIAVISFVTIASFTIGTYVMYLSSAHPFLILFSFIGCTELGYYLLKEKSTAKAPLVSIPKKARTSSRPTA